MKHYQSKRQLSQESIVAATAWWQHLPIGNKLYLKAHQKLTSPQAIAHYWLGCIESQRSYEGAKQS